MYTSQEELQERHEAALVDRLIDVKEEMTDVLTTDIRKTPISKLGLQWVSNARFGSVKLSMYPLTEVISDYGVDGKAFDALLEVLAKSDCPLVAEYRKAIAAQFIEQNAAEVAEATA